MSDYMLVHECLYRLLNSWSEDQEIRSSYIRPRILHMLEHFPLSDYWEHSYLDTRRGFDWVGPRLTRWIGDQILTRGEIRCGFEIRQEDFLDA